MSVFVDFQKSPFIKPRIELTPVQVATLRLFDEAPLTTEARAKGLKIGESVCATAGLWIVCIRCANELGTKDHLSWDNARYGREFKADCPCTERRGSAQGLPEAILSADPGDVLMDWYSLMANTNLAIRCPTQVSRCLTTPLDVRRENMTTVVARCQCWQIDLQAGVYRFRKHLPKVPS